MSKPKSIIRGLNHEYMEEMHKKMLEAKALSLKPEKTK